MHLALRRACADRAPRDEITDELRRDHVEEFAACRQAEAIHVDEQPARDPQPLVDAKAAVEIRVVDEPLPADGRARLLEIHAHDDLERAAETVALLTQS